MALTTAKVTIHGSPKLRAMGWGRLLWAWAALLREFENGEPHARDFAYWYGERALSGLLAAAAWQQSKKSWWALEEFTGRRGHGKSKAGRGDLWIGLSKHPGRNVQASFTIEAKVCWPQSTVVQRTIDDALGKAKKQLRRLNKEYRTGYPMAVCYVVPVLAEAKTAASCNRSTLSSVSWRFSLALGFSVPEFRFPYGLGSSGLWPPAGGLPVLQASAFGWPLPHRPGPPPSPACPLPPRPRNTLSRR